MRTSNLGASYMQKVEQKEIRVHRVRHVQRAGSKAQRWRTIPRLTEHKVVHAN